MAGRNSYTKQFVHDFKVLYAKYGRDVDCYEQLSRDYRNQYPLLNSNQLTRLRLKRKAEFDKAREEHILRVKRETSKREQHLLVRARDLNARTVEAIITAQDEYLYDLGNLNRDDEDYDKQKFGLLKLITSLQKEINAFSGLDFQSGINEFTQKLIRKKLIEDKDIDAIQTLLGDGNESISLEHKEEAIPRITIIKDENHQSEEE